MEQWLEKIKKDLDWFTLNKFSGDWLNEHEQTLQIYWSNLLKIEELRILRKINNILEDF